MPSSITSGEPVVYPTPRLIVTSYSGVSRTTALTEVQADRQYTLTADNAATITALARDKFLHHNDWSGAISDLTVVALKRE